MDIGLVLPTEWASNRDDTEAWAKVTQWAQRAEDAELDSLWVGEHHFMNHTQYLTKRRQLIRSEFTNLS